MRAHFRILNAAVANTTLSKSVAPDAAAVVEGLAPLRVRRLDLVDERLSVSSRYAAQGSGDAAASKAVPGRRGRGRLGAGAAALGATDGAAALGAPDWRPADDAHAATTSGMTRIEYRIRIVMFLLCRQSLTGDGWHRPLGAGCDRGGRGHRPLGGHTFDHHESRGHQRVCGRIAAAPHLRANGSLPALQGPGWSGLAGRLGRASPYLRWHSNRLLRVPPFSCRLLGPRGRGG